MTIPIIFFGDHPAAQSGLARFLRDLALRTHNEMYDDFRVATLGYGSPGSAKLPFPQYHWNQRDDFLPLELPRIVEDFCGEDPFILMTIGDIQRFLQLSDPNLCQERGFGDWTRRMRQSKKMKLWGYFPVDAHGGEGKLGPQLGHTLSHYDRRIVPSRWAQEIVKKTLPNHACDALPHGIDSSVFFPEDKEAARAQFGAFLGPVMRWPQTPRDVPDDALWIGIVATNQNRKDWGLGIEIAAEIKKDRPILLWCHTDKNVNPNGWSLIELLSDLNVLTSSILTVGNVSDDVMRVAYSACDLTLGIGRGEGFSYCGAESIFSGTPHYAGSYGAHVEYMDQDHIVEPFHMRIEGPLNLLRPVYRAEDWIQKIGDGKKQMAIRPDYTDWENLWPQWSKWLQEGL